MIAWVPFNESWGVPDLPDSPAQRHYVQALYHLTKTLDPTRPVVGNDGWESVATDVIGIHDYDDRLAEIARRYGADEAIVRLFRQEANGPRYADRTPKFPLADIAPRHPRADQHAGVRGRTLVAGGADGPAGKDPLGGAFRELPDARVGSIPRSPHNLPKRFGGCVSHWD